MRGFRLFERPLGVFSSHPPLTILGYLPDYEPGVAYEGRLQYINNIGKCHVEIVEANLPPGHYAYVDNFNNEIVLVWPAYSPPDEEKPGIINGDFQLQTLEGWNDLRGNSWNNENSMVYGAAWATPENYVAAMRGVGRGDHTLESVKYPVTPGQQIMARSLWDQGPSNKDNNNLWTAFQFYNSSGGLLGDEIRGDRIHDRTNKSRHWSTVNTTVPGGAADVTVRLIAQRRNGRNRVILVDNVETSGLSYTVGTEVEEDYYVKFKLTDSANRVAYWEGPLFWASNVFTSLLYPVTETDSIGGVGSVHNAYFVGWPTDDFLGRGAVQSVAIADTVAYKTYNHEDSVAGRGQVVGVTITTTVSYRTYNHNAEAFTGRGQIQGITLTVTAAYVYYNDGLPDTFMGRGQIQGVTIT